MWTIITHETEQQPSNILNNSISASYKLIVLYPSPPPTTPFFRHSGKTDKPSKTPSRGKADHKCEFPCLAVSWLWEREVGQLMIDHSARQPFGTHNATPLAEAL